MAFIPYYRVRFTNDLNSEVEILYHKKDGDPDHIVQDYEAMDVFITRDSQIGGRHATLIGSELVVKFDMTDAQVDYWDDFVNAEKGDWYTTATVDGQYFFHGYVLPDEGGVPFQDKPYDATIKATDGIGLLKQIDLSQPDGTVFSGRNLIIEYIAAAYLKTGLSLPIKVIDNVYHDSMFTRATAIENDWFGQGKLHFRTFEKNVSTQVSCYEALEIILKDSYWSFYQDGHWVIKRKAMYQTVAGQEYYTIYDANGENPVGYEENENYSLVGKDAIVYPSDEKMLKFSKFAVQSEKTIFNYKVPEELVNNAKLQNLGDAHTPVLNGWDLVGWEHVNQDMYDESPEGTADAYIKTEYDAFDVETDRYYVVDGRAGTNRIRNSNHDFWVDAGDFLGMSVETRLDVDTATDYMAMDVTIFVGGDPADTLNYWTLSDSGPTLFWLNSPVGSNAFWFQRDGTLDLAQWESRSFEDIRIPVAGSLYISFGAFGVGVGNSARYKNLSIDYKPAFRGSFKDVKGDYHLRSQTTPYQDKAEEETFISDSLKKVIKGTIFANADYNTTPEWYRYGVTEQRHYKELANISRFNFEFKRFWQIEGGFTGLKCAAENNALNQQPLSFHKAYKFVDLPETRLFILVPPLTMNLWTGEIAANFCEVWNAGGDGTQEGDSSEFKYIF